MDFNNPRTLRNMTLNFEQAQARIKVLVKL